MKTEHGLGFSYKFFFSSFYGYWSNHFNFEVNFLSHPQLLKNILVGSDEVGWTFVINFD